MMTMRLPCLLNKIHVYKNNTTTASQAYAPLFFIYHHHRIHPSPTMPALAWLRVLPLLALTLCFPSFVAALRDDKLFTSSVTYCEPPETLLIQHFYVAYHARNHSISFNISAASVEPNVSVSANLYLNVYGMNPVNVTIDLCSLFDGALCPLPMYNFTGADSLVLPEKLGVASQIPGIAYKMPDLEAFAQLSLVEVGTGSVKACVQATLTNGWSTHQVAVEWAVAAIALFALISALWQSASPNSLAPFRLLDLFYLYQAIATTSLLSINYPSVYRSFTLNFAWAMGLITSSSSSLQTSIDRMRHLTGGKMADTSAGSSIGLINRKLSPYNFPGNRLAIPSQNFLSDGFDTQPLANFLASPNLPEINTSKLHLLAADADAGVATVTTASPNVLQAGVPIFTNSLHIGTANAFMTVFLICLILLAIVVALIGIGYAALSLVNRRKWWSPERRRRFHSAYTPLAKSWVLRIVLIIFSPLMIFAMYQWTLKDSWLSIFIAVVTFLSLLAYVSYISQLVFRFARHNSPSALYSDDQLAVAHGPLFSQYRPQRFYFGTSLLVAAFLRAIVIAAAHGHGQTQAILLVVIEAFVLISRLVLRPHHTRGADVFSSYLAITRLVGTGLLLAFVESLNVKAIPRVVIGVIAAVIFSVAVIVTFINIVLHVGIQRLWQRRKTDETRSLTSSTTDTGSVDREKKGDYTTTVMSTSADQLMRPGAPTPDQSSPLSSSSETAHYLQPLASSTPSSSAGLSTVPSSWQSSAFNSVGSPTPGSIPDSHYSGSTTLGSVLPRRWSFQPSSPPVSTPGSESGWASMSASTSPSAGYMSPMSQSPGSPSPMAINSVRPGVHPSAQHGQ
ncbi:hypothetical protein HGRIS_002215 [Hohenbuehelia grisea]|uniref:ML-like domain-containing protein n=1 Tax=Hohenbuehelia grisea TaxID=104357 RepID=A0ABR3JJV0_9AGAR